MSSSVVTSSLGSKRLSPGSVRLLARARVARQDDVQIIGPSGNFHREGWHMAICIAPCSLSWMATGHSQRLGAQEEAASHLMYFYPRILYPHPVGESCPRVEVGLSTASGEQAARSPVLWLQIHTWADGGKQGTGCLAHTFPVEANLQEGSMLVALNSWASQLGHMTFFKAIACAGARATPALQRDEMLLESRERKTG